MDGRGARWKDNVDGGREEIARERERDRQTQREREIPCDGEMEDGRWRARELEWLGVRGLKERPVDLLGG